MYLSLVIGRETLGMGRHVPRPQPPYPTQRKNARPRFFPSSRVFSVSDMGGGG